MLATFLVQNMHSQLQIPDPARPQTQHYWTDDRDKHWSMIALSHLLEDGFGAKR